MTQDILTVTRRTTTLPPTEVEGYIVMLRQPRDEFVVIILPNQDSYEVNADDARKYLKLIGVPESVGFLAYVWNFYAARLDLITFAFEG